MEDMKEKSDERKETKKKRKNKREETKKREREEKRKSRTKEKEEICAKENTEWIEQSEGKVAEEEEEEK